MTRAGPGEDRLDGSGAADTAAAAATGERCGTQRTYDLLKQELFRRAAQVRGSDQAAFDRLSAYATVRVGAPVVKRQDEQLGTQVCSGRVAIDLPPGVGVVGGRRTLTADVDYALQPASDGSGDVVTLSGADAIIVPLATLARVGTQPGLPQPAPATPPSDQLPASEPPAPDVAVPGSPPPSPPVRTAPPPEPGPVVDLRPRETSARPSFNCRNARTRGEIAVCNDAGLASLDRQMAQRYGQAVSNGDVEQRRLLQQTRLRFLRFRDGCRSDDCVADAYRGRIREIQDIEAGRWRAPG